MPPAEDRAETYQQISMCFWACSAGLKTPTGILPLLKSEKFDSGSTLVISILAQMISVEK